MPPGSQDNPTRSGDCPHQGRTKPPSGQVKPPKWSGFCLQQPKIIELFLNESESFRISNPSAASSGVFMNLFYKLSVESCDGNPHYHTHHGSMKEGRDSYSSKESTQAQLKSCRSRLQWPLTQHTSRADEETYPLVAEAGHVKSRNVLLTRDFHPNVVC